MLSIKEAKETLQNFDRRSARVWQEVRKFGEQAVTLSEARQAADAAIAADAAELAVVAGARDFKAVDEIFARMQTRRAARAEKARQLSDLLGGNNPAIQSIGDACNAACAMAGIAEVLSEVWFSLPTEVQKKIHAKTANRLQW